jgi:hypothetical protein
MKTYNNEEAFLKAMITGIRMADADIENELSGKIDTGGRRLNDLTDDELQEELSYFWDDNKIYLEK